MITVIIPTLQKNKEIFYNLLQSLNNDERVAEIVVIDNSLQGVDFVSDKLKLIVPEQNLYVNPSWNLGVKVAGCDKVAILNDDIVIPDGFCGAVAGLLDDSMGILGYDFEYVKPIYNQEIPRLNENISLTPISCRSPYWGIALFCNKKSYFEIPEEMKIWSGDDYLLYMNKKVKRQNYNISGQWICHWGSLSSGQKSFNAILENDKKIYRKLTIKWYHRLFSIEEFYEGYKFRILGITWRVYKKKI